MDDITFNPGGIPDAPDERDYKLEDVIGLALPPFDWHKGYDVEDELRVALKNPSFHLPIKDQGQSGSCGGQAWSYYGEVLEALQTGTFEERSAKFIYAQTFVPGGGSSGRVNCKLVQSQGWGKETLTPSYDAGKAPSEAFMERVADITQTARNAATGARAGVYAAPNYLDIDSIASAIQMNHGVIIGIDGANNGSWRSADPRPPLPGQSPWFHWLYAGKAKLRNGHKAFSVAESWGQSVGENGWQWINENYVNTPGAIFNVWTIVYDTTVVPPSFTHNFVHNMVLGDRSDEVAALQTALKTLGLFTAPVTGLYGPITAQAVGKFQASQGIFPTAPNSVGPMTRRYLNTLFNK